MNDPNLAHIATNLAALVKAQEKANLIALLPYVDEDQEAAVVDQLKTAHSGARPRTS